MHDDANSIEATCSTTEAIAVGEANKEIDCIIERREISDRKRLVCE